VLLIEHQTTFDDLLRWPPNVLNRAWDRLSLRVQAPDESKPSMTVSSIEAMVADVERRLAREGR
jgi:hypothetical protein